MDITKAIAKGFLKRTAAALMLAGVLVGGTLVGAGASPASAQPVPRPAISINDVSVVEGDSGIAEAVFTVRLSEPNPTASDISVRFSTVGGSAKGVNPTCGFAAACPPDTDFFLTNGTLIFKRGESSKEIVVRVLGDRRAEGDETFFVTLSNASGATIADARGQGTIRDDGDPQPAISIADAEIDEGTVLPNGGLRTMLFKVTLNNPSDQEVRVDFATADGSAVGADCPPVGVCPALRDGAADFAHAAGTLVFAPGRDQQFVRVSVFSDRQPEGDETFVVRLSNPVGATIADGQARGLIRNDDR